MKTLEKLKSKSGGRLVVKLAKFHKLVICLMLTLTPMTNKEKKLIEERREFSVFLPQVVNLIS